MVDEIRELKVDELDNVVCLRELEVDELESVSGGCACCHCDSQVRSLLAFFSKNGI